MGAEVFVSYSSLDRDRVMPVVESLRGNGISVWVDEGNIHAADLWSEQIVQAIADCRVMVVMLSQNSTDSHNVVKEVMLASEQKKAYYRSTLSRRTYRPSCSTSWPASSIWNYTARTRSRCWRTWLTAWPSAASVGKVNQLPRSQPPSSATIGQGRILLPPPNRITWPS